MKIKKGDPVVVVTGANKGARGTVTKVLPGKNKVVVEGVNLKTKHNKPSQDNPGGGIEKVEAPVDASNVAFFDEQSGSASRLRIERKDGKRVRVAVKSGRELDN